MSDSINSAIIGLGFGAEFIPIYQRHPHANLLLVIGYRVLLVMALYSKKIIITKIRIKENTKTILFFSFFRPLVLS